METRKYRYAAVVGVFISIGLAIFILTVFVLGGEQKSFSKKFYLKVVFDEINGLKEGNNVWFNGVKIGIVKKIELKGPSEVEVTMSVEKKVQPYIKQNALAKIGRDGYLGNRVVIIYGGTTNVPPVEENAFLGIQKDSLGEANMLATLQSSNKNLSDITSNLKIISAKIASGTGTIGKLVNDSSLAIEVQQTFKALRITATEAKSTLANLQGFTTRMNDKNSAINKLFMDTVLYDSIKLAVIQLNSILQTTDSFANNINRFSVSMNKASAQLNDSSGAAGMLLNDRQTAEDLYIIIQNLKSASKKLDQDLEALQHNFLLKGYFKKNQ